MSSKRALVLLALVGFILSNRALAADEKALVPLESGATLEWKRSKDKPGQLKVAKIEKKSPAAEIGYRKGDEIVAMDGDLVGNDTLAASLLLSRNAEHFRIRRNKEELELPVLFRAAAVIEGSVEHEIKPGQRAPELEAKTIEGEPVQLAGFAGKVMLINFWAVWCKPCLEEMPALWQLHRRYASKGLVILSVNLDDDRSTLRKFLKSNNLPFVFVYSPGMGSRSAGRYGIRSIPANFLVDREGVIRQVTTGYGPHFVEKSLIPAAELLLAGTKPVVSIVHKR